MNNSITLADRLKIPTSTKAILWDMDGVLMDSLGLDLEVCNQLLQKYCREDIELSRDFIRSIFAYNIPKFWELIFEKVAKECSFTVSSADRQKIITEYDNLRNNTKFRTPPGINAIIFNAKERGLLNIVVSNNPKKEIEKILSMAEILSQFNLIIGNDSTPDMQKKPAPDIYLLAMKEANLKPEQCVVVEDALLGIESGKSAGCFTIGVATGGATREELEQAVSKPDVIYRNFAAPLTSKMFVISQLAKKNPISAGEQILEFIQEDFPALEATEVIVKQSQVSLNSVMGEIRSTKEGKLFFKFHAEENEESTANLEYYNSVLMTENGLPCILPLYSKTAPGSQFLMYKFIEYPTAFDEYYQEDVSFVETKKYDESLAKSLLKADQGLSEKISRVYLDTLEEIPGKEMQDCGLYQLFNHRLVAEGVKPRLDIYYTGQPVILPKDTNMDFDDVAKLRWTINGITYDETLSEIIQKSKELLDPLQSEKMPTVIGHGDDHNGNKFFIDGEFIFFDPAFAGRQPALLSFAKSTIHNVFLHPFWFYNSSKTKDFLEIDFEIQGNNIEVNHNWEFERVAPLRLEVLKIYEEIVWLPLMREMKKRNILPVNWREYLRAAFFCCPFLCLNIIDPKQYTPEQSLLALSMCVYLGSKSDIPNRIEEFMNNIDH